MQLTDEELDLFHTVLCVALDKPDRHGTGGRWGPGDGEHGGGRDAAEIRVGEGVRLRTRGLRGSNDGESAGDESGEETHCW